VVQAPTQALAQPDLLVPVTISVTNGVSTGTKAAQVDNVFHYGQALITAIAPQGAVSTASVSLTIAGSGFGKDSKNFPPIVNWGTGTTLPLGVGSVAVAAGNGSGTCTGTTVSLTFTGGGGSGATATATCSKGNRLKSFKITSRGTGYTSP